MLLTRRIHPVLGREELTQVGGPFRRESPSSAASEEAPRRHATALDALPYLHWQIPHMETQEAGFCSDNPLWGPWSADTNRNSAFPFLMNRPWVVGPEVWAGAKAGLDCELRVGTITHPGSGRCPGGRAAGECSPADPCCNAWGLVLTRCPHTHNDLAMQGRGGWLIESQIPHLGLKEIGRNDLVGMPLETLPDRSRKGDANCRNELPIF